MITVRNKKKVFGVILFLLPALVIYIVFQIIPLIQALCFSFMEWNGIAGAKNELCGIAQLQRGVFQC